MANKIQVKRSAVAGKVPTTGDLDLGEIAINTYDGKMYIEKNDGTASIVQIGDVVGPATTPDNAVARFDGTTGKLIQSSTATLDDNGNLANVNSIAFDTTPSTPPTAAGSVYWDSDYGTAAIVMGGGNVIQQVGEDQYYFGKNQTGSSIAKGTVVRANGTVGASGRILITPAIGDNSVPPEYFMGVTAEAIANGADGVVQWFGSIKGVDATGQGGETWADGDVLYLSPTTAGALTNVEPTAPYQKTIVALVINAAANGTIFVRPTIGHKLEDVNNVNITSATNADLLQYDSGNGYWENVAPGSVSVGTATNLAGGGANQVPYQTASGATSFVAAPTTSNTVLTWNGTALTWAAGGGGSSIFPRDFPVKKRDTTTVDVTDTIFALSTKPDGIYVGVTKRNGVPTYITTNLI